MSSELRDKRKKEELELGKWSMVEVVRKNTVCLRSSSLTHLTHGDKWGQWYKTGKEFSRADTA